jgi:hypothetical protein
MAFPTISDADTKSGLQSSNSTSWTITYCQNIAADDLLLLFVATDGIPNLVLNGWVSANGNSGANSGWVFKKKAVGSETGTFTLTLGTSEQGAWRMFRIPASSWEGTLGTTFTNDSTGGAVQRAGTSTASPSATPDPPSLDPSEWATEDTLWIAAISVDTSRTISAYPSNMADRHTADVSGGSTGATLGLATAESAASSFDPGTFTISASDDWHAIVLAIRPAGSSTITFTPAARPVDVNPVSHALGLSLAFAPAARPVDVNPVAPALASVLTFAPAARPVDVNPVAPALVPGALALTPAAVAADVNPVAPTLSSIYTLSPPAMAADVSPVGPALALSLAFAPAALVADVNPVSAALALGAYEMAPPAVAADVNPVAPVLATIYTLTPAAVAAGVAQVAPALEQVYTMAPNAVAAALAQIAPAFALSLVLTPGTVAAPVLVIVPVLDTPPAGEVNFTPAAVAAILARGAPTLSLGLDFTPAAVATSAFQVAPVIDHPLDLAPNPVLLPLTVSAALAPYLVLEAGIAQLVLASVAPQLAMALSLAPPPVAAVVDEVAPSLGLVYPFAPSPVVVDLTAIAPELGAGFFLLAGPVSVQLAVVGPGFPIWFQPSPAVVELLVSLAIEQVGTGLVAGDVLNLLPPYGDRYRYPWLVRGLRRRP